jgi:hypothetical protein
MESSN